MPFRLGLIGQTSDNGWIGFLHLRVYVSRVPDMQTTHGGLPRSVELAQIVVRACQSAGTSELECSVIRLLRQRVNSWGNLHRRRQLVGDEGVAPLTHQRGIQEQGAVKRVTKGLHTLV